MSGHNYPTLKERITYLCSLKGIEASSEKLPRILARELINTGLVFYLPEDKEKTIDNIRKKIERDLKNDTAASIPGDHIDLYCRFFSCSSDFLMGYIDTPTHEEKSIQDLTELHPSAVKTLLYKDSKIISALNDLLIDIEKNNDYKSDSISDMKRILLHRIHYYFNPATLRDLAAAGDALILKDDYTFVTSFFTVKDTAAPAVQMLAIQESLQDIKRYYQKKQ